MGDNKNVIRIVLVAVLLFVLVGLAVFTLWRPGWLGNIIPGAQGAAVALVDLSSAANFAVLAGASVVDANLSVIVGDIGLSPASASFIAVSCPEITGTIYGVDAAYVGACFAGNPPLSNKTLVDNAKLALTAAYTATANETPATTLVGSDNQLGGKTLNAGIYTFSSAATANIIGTVTLDAQGDPNAVFVFQTASTLVTDSASVVHLINGAQACHVFWQVGTSATLGTGTQFAGTIMADQSITDAGGSTVDGRLLASIATVTLNNTHVTVPTCTSPPVLRVIKHVINDSGTGASTASAWTLTVATSNGGTGIGNAVGAESPGTVYTLQVGHAYSVAESGGPSGYTASLSSECTVPNAVSGTTYTCTITNDDIPPASATLHIIKSVINVSGTATPPDFTIHVKSSTSTLDVAGSPQAGTSTPGTLYTLAAGDYIVTEDQHPLLPTYHQTFGLDCVGGTFTLAPGQDKICTVINTDIPPPAPVVASSGGGGGGGSSPVPLIALTKIPQPLALPGGAGPVTYTYTVKNIGTVAMSNVSVKDDKCSAVTYVSGDSDHDSMLGTNEIWEYTCTKTVSATETNTATARGSANGFDAYAVAVATVAVGTSAPPPLINVVKVPSRLTPLLYGGGAVTYTYTVTNPGVVALHEVLVTDDKCTPVSRTSGDTNGNTLLDTTETWVYTCTTNVALSTRNVATAAGKANGLLALGYAFATVLVTAPGLPNTGLPPLGEDGSHNMITDAMLTFVPTTGFRIKIPSIKVDAALESVGLTPDGAVGTPYGPTNAAWLNVSPRPGDEGVSIIDGHFGWAQKTPAVFDNLSTVQKGDKLYIEDESGADVTFVVRKILTYGERDDASGAFAASDGGAHLVLITCGGVWNSAEKSYSQRLVVLADKE